MVILTLNVEIEEMILNFKGPYESTSVLGFEFLVSKIEHQ